MQRCIEGLYIGLPKEINNNTGQFVSGIEKSPATEIYVAKDRIEGDGVANTVNHGGPDRVICAYAREHYDYWAEDCGFKLPPCAFGENLTLRGMREADVCIGDVYQIGEAVVQVSQGRYPCYTISRRNEYDPMLAKVLDTGFTGYFFRVLTEGRIRSDSSIKLIEPHPRRITVAYANEVMLRKQGGEAEVTELLELAELASAWKNILSKIRGLYS
jgi:MOSC domain-containing protein YiiM